jgi:toxin ParE1/3/4
MTRVSFHRLAERELNDAALYYEQESAGLGIKFLNEVESNVGCIVANPKPCQKIRGEVHRRVLRKFPYGILYSVIDRNIRVLAIMNLKRKPNYWVNRA